VGAWAADSDIAEGDGWNEQGDDQPPVATSPRGQLAASSLLAETLQPASRNGDEAAAALQEQLEELVASRETLRMRVAELEGLQADLEAAVHAAERATSERVAEAEADAAALRHKLRAAVRKGKVLGLGDGIKVA